MPAQITNTFDPKSRRLLASHDQSVSIIESEIFRHPDALLLERSLNIGLGRAWLLQNLLGNGAGVFRININAAAA